MSYTQLVTACKDGLKFEVWGEVIELHRKESTAWLRSFCAGVLKVKGATWGKGSIHSSPSPAPTCFCMPSPLNKQVEQVSCPKLWALKNCIIAPLPKNRHKILSKHPIYQDLMQREQNNCSCKQFRIDSWKFSWGKN